MNKEILHNCSKCIKEGSPEDGCLTFRKVGITLYLTEGHVLERLAFYDCKTSVPDARGLLLHFKNLSTGKDVFVNAQDVVGFAQ